MDFTAHAEALINALRGTEDSDKNADRQRVIFVAQLRAFLSAWQYLLRNYLVPPPFRQIFKSNFEQLIGDTKKLILDIRRCLSNAQQMQERARSTSRFYKSHISGHILVTFFGQPVIHLRQQQILYATTVIELISLVIM